MKSPLHLTSFTGMHVCTHTHILSKSWWAISLDVTQVLEWSSSLGKKKKEKLPTSCIKWNNNPELREKLPSPQMVNYLSADIEQYTLCRWCTRFPMCVALESVGVWSCIIILLFLTGETPAPSMALKSIISHKGTWMSPAALSEVFGYVTRTKGCCWQKLLESKPWDYLSAPRATPLEHPKGPQSVHCSCFLISSFFSPPALLLFLWLWICHKDFVFETACKITLTTVLLGW